MMEWDTIVVGDALTVLRTLPDAIFDVGVTSPPTTKGNAIRDGW